MKICNLIKEKETFRETIYWTPVFNTISKLTFTVNQDIIFHGIGFFGRTSKNLTIPTSENFTIVLENSDYIKMFEETVCIEQDGTSKMYKLLLNKPFLMKANEAYTVQLYRRDSWAEHFITYEVKTKYHCEGVKFKLRIVCGSFINAFLFEKAGGNCECVLC